VLVAKELIEFIKIQKPKAFCLFYFCKKKLGGKVANIAENAEEWLFISFTKKK